MYLYLVKTMNRCSWVWVHSPVVKTRLLSTSNTIAAWKLPLLLASGTNRMRCDLPPLALSLESLAYPSTSFSSPPRNQLHSLALPIATDRPSNFFSKSSGYCNPSVRCRSWQPKDICYRCPCAYRCCNCSLSSFQSFRGTRLDIVCRVLRVQTICCCCSCPLLHSV